jgi:hypothetical protein
MRVLAAIFAVLGIAISGIVAVIAYQAMEVATQAIARIKETPEYKLAMVIGEEQAKNDPQMRKTLDDLKKAEDDFKEAKMKVYALCATPIVGMIALVLVFMGQPLISGLLFAVAGVGPYFLFPVPLVFLFCGWFLPSALFAFFSPKGAAKEARSSKGYFRDRDDDEDDDDRRGRRRRDDDDDDDDDRGRRPSRDARDDEPDRGRPRDRRGD